MTAFSYEKLSKESLIERIDYGDDIEFTLRGKRYTILGWYEGGPLIAETTHPGEDKGIQFKTGTEMVEKYSVENIPLAKLIDEIETH